MKYILTGLCMLMITLVQAQKVVQPGWLFGVKADFNLSNISGNGMASGYTAGGQGGVYAEYRFNNLWSIQPELLFTQNNTKKGDFITYYPGNGNTYAAEDVKLAYASIPVMFKYNVTPAFSFLVGPQYSFLITDAESLLANGAKAFKKSEFSANAGAQFNVGRVALYGRYNLGISNINDIDTRNPWRSRHIQLGIAVRIF